MNGALPEEKSTKFSSTNQPEHDRAEAGRASGRARLLSSALEFALKREVADDKGNKITQAHAIANALADKAASGDVQAFKEVADRTEGKAAQSITIEGNPDKPLTHNFVFNPVGPADEPANTD